jgi:Uma2 family endonuclease
VERWRYTGLLMAIETKLSLAEFIEADYGREVELVDGELWERNVGDFSHSRLEALLAAWFAAHEHRSGVVALIEMDVIVLPQSLLKPDVTLVPFGSTPDRLVDPPLLAVEILSPSDSLRKTKTKCEEYVRMGVNAIWIIDPKARIGLEWVGGQWAETRRLEVAGTGIVVNLDDLFAKLDASRAR